MASGLYDKGREGFLDSSIDFDTDTIKAVLTTAAYTVDLAAHDFLNDVAPQVGTPQTLASKTVTAGVADAADITFPSVAGGSTCTALILYKDTGVATTSRLIAYIDGFSVVTNGGDITVQWDNGANKIFKL